MSRWKVWREWPIPSETPDAWEPWCAWDGEQRDSKQFPTHAEALEYADRKARTREVVLPRTAREKVIADRGVYSLHVHHREHATDIRLGGWDGITVENQHLKPLGAYLYALGEVAE